MNTAFLPPQRMPSPPSLMPVAPLGQTGAPSQHACNPSSAPDSLAAATAGLAVTDTTGLVGVALVVIGAADPISVAIIEGSPAPLASAAAALPAVSLGTAGWLAEPAITLGKGVGRSPERMFGAFADSAGVDFSRERRRVNLHDAHGTAFGCNLVRGRGECGMALKSDEGNHFEKLHGV